MKEFHIYQKLINTYYRLLLWGQQFIQSYSVNLSYQKSEKDDSWQRQFIK
jgi:hypothetical protein